MPHSARLRRSLLFVPGGEPRKVERARGAGADTLLFDLEDSVPPDAKADARAHVAAALRASSFDGSAEPAVRVNPPGTPFFEEDLAAVVQNGGGTVMVPKSECAEQLAQVDHALERLERERAGGGERVRILALVETPAGIVQASALRSRAPRVEALCFGHADFSLQMGLTEADASRGIAYHARCNLVLAARASGVVPIDTVYLAVKDDEAFRRDAELGRSLGFEGKLCIHPRQVEIANAVYTPAAHQVAYATRVVEAWERAQADGRGVFTVDGKMVDAPLVAAQQRVLDLARRAAELTG
jgi:citrate lyase subunit beta/citryl-CoA lyase